MSVALTAAADCNSMDNSFLSQNGTKSNLRLKKEFWGRFIEAISSSKTEKRPNLSWTNRFWNPCSEKGVPSKLG